MGKFTLDRFGQSGPAHSPLYEIPLQVKNATHILFRHEADRDAVEDILPEGCELTGGPAHVWTLVQCASAPLASRWSILTSGLERRYPRKRCLNYLQGYA